MKPTYIELERERLARLQNIAANGRWGVASMAVVALVGGHMHLAFLFALVLLAANLAEQLPAGLPRAAGVLGVVLFTAILVVALFFAIIR